jgi:hypothetical protein
MVAEVGLEPTRGYPRQILSLLWLPISPLGHNQDCVARRTMSVVLIECSARDISLLTDYGLVDAFVAF